MGDSSDSPPFIFITYKYCMSKKEVIAQLETILSETKLPERCGKYAFADRAGWFYKNGRGKLEAIVKAMKNEG